MPNLMKCHYEVLEAARDADADVLKKQYRKMALKYHPDKNPDDPEGAKQTFQVIQQAYDVLSDPQERAWYDNHREQILRGGLGEKLEEEGLELFQFFSSSCYSGFGDDEGGFYGVYDEVFNTLAKEDMDFIDDEDSDFEIPSFGKAADDYETVVGPFYAYWTSYSTPRSFSWLDKYDTRQGENRWVKRKMEAENKKLRDKARKERNEVVRNLVQFVRKRDKRVVEWSKKLQEKAELNKKKTEEFQKKQREERKKLFEGGGTGGFHMTEMEDQLRQLEGAYTDSESEDEDEPELATDEEEELGEELDDLYCVACDKMFKTVGSKENHETSRKHKDNLDKLIEEMKEEEVNSDNDDRLEGSNVDVASLKDTLSENDSLEDEISQVKIALPTEPQSKAKSKKQKKKQKKKVLDIVDGSCSEPEENEVPEDDVSEEKIALPTVPQSKSKSKKQKKKQKKKVLGIVGDSGSEHEANDLPEDEVSVERIPLSSEPLSKSKSKKQKKKQKKKLLDVVDDSCSEPEVVDEFLKPVDGSSDDDSNRKRKTKNKKKKSKKEKSQSPDDSSLNILVSDKENLNENSEINKEILAQETELVDKVEAIVPEEEVTIIKASVEDNDVNEFRSKKSKHKQKENIEYPAQVDLLCAQCRAPFPSKNKLFNHLKTSGHAVHIPSDSMPAMTSKSKKKNKK